MIKCKKKKIGIETPEYGKPTPPPPPTSGSNAFKPNPNYIPPASVKQSNDKTMYGLKFFIPFEDFNKYLRNHIDETYRDRIFIPVKAEINEVDLSVDITLLSTSLIEYDSYRYKLDLNQLPKEN